MCRLDASYCYIFFYENLKNIRVIWWVCVCFGVYIVLLFISYNWFVCTAVYLHFHYLFFSHFPIFCCFFFLPLCFSRALSLSHLSCSSPPHAAYITYIFLYLIQISQSMRLLRFLCRCWIFVVVVFLVTVYWMYYVKFIFVLFCWSFCSGFFYFAHNLF